MNPGDLVRFKTHGETGLDYKVITREGDDVQLLDQRSRVLVNVPVELLIPSSAARSPEACDCPRAANGEHWNWCGPGHPYRKEKAAK